ncbi:MAG: lysine--tRNA ligase [Chthoniobacterales bacterium]|nr:MAG: lysine--tRNA ligase [Chthoniobacterales bacterium]
MRVRLAKADRLKAAGIEPYPVGYPRTHTIAQVRERHGDLPADTATGDVAGVAGRVLLYRTGGKLCFASIKDGTGEIQVMVARDKVGEDALAAWKSDVDIGDHVGVTGEIITSRSGELSVLANSFAITSKSLRPLPDKHAGLTDPQSRVRMRYVDLIVNPEARRLAELRAAVTRAIREELHSQGYVEAETPMLQTLHGGANARPFSTHINAYDMQLYLRIALELYLKRLMVGGLEKVYELGRNFRNEGADATHNPEFTMLEAYWAYADYDKIANMVEEMICHLAEQVAGGLQVEHRDAEGNVTRTLNLTQPWRRARYRDLVREVAGADWFELSSEQRRERARSLAVEMGPHLADFEVTQHVFEKLVEEKTFDPLFVTHCPKELVPLAKQNVDEPDLVDVYELIINGVEISPGYTELNDPVVQRQRLLAQAGEETQKIDEDFLLALEHGMPPAGGFGLGIDRLTMLLTGAESIRDVILFPLLKPRRVT